MSSWILVPCLVSLRDEFNDLNPDRDKTTDGSVGDEAHQQRSSNHNPDETGNTPHEDSDSKNEVHAIDVDKTGPWPAPMTFDLAIEELRKRHQDGRDNRLIEIIWNRRRATPESGWKWKDYSGENAHTEHAHLAASYESSREADTRPWGLVERWGDMALSSDDKEWIKNEIRQWVGDVVQRYDGDAQEIHGSGNDTMAVHSALQYLARDLTVLDNKVDQLIGALQPSTTGAAKPAKSTTVK